MQEFNPEVDLRKFQTITPSTHDFKMVIPPGYHDPYLLNRSEEFTAHLILSHSSDDMLFIDIGAHHGFYPLLVGTKHQNARIIAFEPVPENYEILTANLKLNNVNHVEAYDLAVSNKDEIKILKVTEASDSCGFYAHPKMATLKFIEVKAIALDSLLKEIPDVPTTIKIDTEGHELWVLEGMKGTLNKTHNTNLFLGFNPERLRSAGCRPEDLLEKIDRLGFDIYFIDDELRQTYKVSPNDFKNWTDYLGDQTHKNIFCRKKPEALSVCFFSHSSGFAGAERRLLELTSRLIRDRGVICSVVLPNEGPLIR